MISFREYAEATDTQQQGQKPQIMDFNTAKNMIDKNMPLLMQNWQNFMTAVDGQVKEKILEYLKRSFNNIVDSLGGTVARQQPSRNARLYQ